MGSRARHRTKLEDSIRGGRLPKHAGGRFAGEERGSNLVKMRLARDTQFPTT